LYSTTFFSRTICRTAHVAHAAVSDFKRKSLHLFIYLRKRAGGQKGGKKSKETTRATLKDLKPHNQYRYMSILMGSCSVGEP